MTQITIYHNPKCGTSRNVLRLLQHLGYEPQVIHYLETPPTTTELQNLVTQMGCRLQDILRTNVPEYEQLGNPEELSQEQLLSKMIQAPILINRPIVIGDKGTKLCRPAQEVLSIVKAQLTSDFIKDNGEVIKTTN